MSKHRESAGDVPNVQSLLDAERELTQQEQGALREASTSGWRRLTIALQLRAKNTYAQANSDEFAECVFRHMSATDQSDMVVADIYHCPTCGRLIKDRKSPIASALLLERARVRELWMDVEQSPPEQMDAALNRFRAALGLRP